MSFKGLFGERPSDATAKRLHSREQSCPVLAGWEVELTLSFHRHALTVLKKIYCSLKMLKHKYCLTVRRMDYNEEKRTAWDEVHKQRQRIL